MKRKKLYRLWTFQSTQAVEELKTRGVLEASWDCYKPTDTFTRAYRWMAMQIAARNINCNHAPIWAWHSCRAYEGRPTLVDARSLLSDIEIEAGIQVIEFECPAELAVLSSYGIWNMILHDYFYTNDEATISKETEDKLFNTSRKKFKKYDCIQATLPYLDLVWVKDIRALHLKPNYFDFNEHEEV